MMSAMTDEMVDYLKAEALQPIPGPVAAVAAAAAARHNGVRAVLFYGSCLRDSDLAGRIADLYLVVGSYKEAHRSRITALFNWLLPPNVGYVECEVDATPVRAKYAVISIKDFERATSGRWFHSYIWARFCQPCRIAQCASADDERRLVAALAGAVGTMEREVRPLLPTGARSEELWSRAFRETFRAELRAERPERAAEIVAMDADRYAVLGGIMDNERGDVGAQSRSIWPARNFCSWKWFWRRWWGKLLSIARLTKAAFTFEDGGTYILWKIERHSGVTVTPTPWQRRHPILASTTLFWKLYRKGAFR
jgi:hypothetical protein